MELEEIKLLWQQYDKNIQQNNSLNDSIIKKMLQQRSQDVINKMTGYEYLNISVGAIVLILLVGFIKPFMSLTGVNTLLVVCYIVSMICAALVLGFNLYMVNYLNKTDAAKPVTETVKRVDTLALILSKGKVFSIVILPVFVLAGVAVGRKLAYNENVFEHMRFFGPIFLVALTLGIIATILLHRTLYTNRINAIKQNLEELNSFKQG